MPNQVNPSEKAANMRRRAEEALQEKAARLPPVNASLSPAETAGIQQELEVHQIELEMQNDELRRAQAELAAERERYFNLFELAPVGYCTLSASGLIDKINLTAASLLGASRSALIKKPFSRFIAKEDQDFYYLHLKKLLESGDPESCELRMLKGDETQWWARLEATAAQDEDGSPTCRVILSDITGRKKAEEALREIESRMRFSLESCQIGVWDLDLIDHSAYRTFSHDSIFGYQELLPKWTYEMFLEHVLPEDRSEVDRKYSEAIRTQSNWSFECRIRRTDHKIRWIWASGRHSIPENGKARRMVGIIQDITERKVPDDRLKESLEKLNHSYAIEKQQRQELQEEAQARGMFIDILAHELRTPLTPVAVCSAMLQETLGFADAALQKRLIQTLFKGTQSLTQRLEELLDLGKLSRGTFTLRQQMVNVTGLVTKTAALFKPLVEQQARQLILEIQDNLPEIEADPARLEQVLSTLLSNALKYSPKNTTITLKAGKMERYVVIEVVDEGTGLTPDEQKKLFDPYHRVMQDTQKYSGIGLGLAISKLITEAHGGSMLIESLPNKNTCFRLKIPIKGLEGNNETAAG